MRYIALTYKDKWIVAGTSLYGQVQLLTVGTGLRDIYERVELGDDRVALRLVSQGAPAAVGSLVTAIGPSQQGHPGMLTLAAGEIGEPQTFQEVWLPDDTIALRTHLGTYVCAENDGAAGPIVTNRTALGEWERFNYVVPPQELLPREEPPATHAVGSVTEAQTHASHASSVAQSVEGVATHTDVGAGRRLRDQIFRPPGG
jgi:hypothetical protein